MINLIRLVFVISGAWPSGAEKNTSEVSSVAQGFIANGELSQWNNSLTEQSAISSRNISLPGVESSWQDCHEEELLKVRPLSLSCGDKTHAQSDGVVADNPLQEDKSLCEIAAPYINNQEGKSLAQLHRPSDGHTEVYLQDSVVIKDSGDRDVIAKHLNTQHARNICEKFGYQLEIPTSCIYRKENAEGLFEKMLSVQKRYPVSTREAAAFAYYQNPAAFTERVKDFTGFLMQVRIGDLIAWGPNQARYDNVAPYLEYTDSGPVAKIALLDLDHYTPMQQSTDPVSAFMIAITFFPHHYNEILEVAKQFFPNIENDRYTLEIYGEHLKQEGIQGIALNPNTLMEWKDFRKMGDEIFREIDLPLEYKRYWGVSSNYEHITLKTFSDDALRDMDAIFAGKWRVLQESNITYQNIDFVKPIIYTPEREKKLEEAIQKSWSDYTRGLNPGLGASLSPWLGSGDRGFECNDCNSQAILDRPYPKYVDLETADCKDKITHQAISEGLFGPDQALVQVVKSLGETIHEKFRGNIAKAEVHPDMSLFDIAKLRAVKLVLPLNHRIPKEIQDYDLDLYREIRSLLPPHTDFAFANMFIKNVVMPAVWRDLQENGDIGEVRRGKGRTISTKDHDYYISI